MSFFTQSLHEIDGIYVPIDDTLNVKGGMNYAQFLSALLRIAYIKAEQSGDQSPQAYKNALDAMFNPNMRTDAQGRQTEDPSLASRIDIKKRQADDPILAYVYEPDNLKIFYQCQPLLCAIFHGKSIKLGETFLQMPKSEFINIMRDIDLLILPKKKTPEEEKKEKEAREKVAAN